MSVLYLDLETYCTVNIRHGAYRYAEEAEVMLVAIARDNDPVDVWETQDKPDWREALREVIEAADTVVIHNSNFDRTVLREQGINIPVEKIVDTMVLALQHSLPGALGQLCDVLNVPQDKAKDKAGKKLINRFTKPCPKNMKLRRATRETHPDEWTAFIEYARLDVDAMRDVHGRVPHWNDNDYERNLWRTDQRINDRGIAVDLDFARSALRAFDRASRTLASRAAHLTGGSVTSATQRQRLLDYFDDTLDFVPEDLTRTTLGNLLGGKLDPKVRELLEIRQQAAATSPAKYTVLLNGASRDGRLRGLIQFCGAARTGRDAGRLFQPQNLPRSPDWFDDVVQETTVAAFKADCEDIIWDNVSERCAFGVRGALVAPVGKKLVIADLSNIEGRVLAWLANEEWKIAAFKVYDRGEGHDLYKVTAGRILGKDPGDITKTERQLQGKVPELAGGYQGGVGAYRKMGGAVFDAMTDEAIQKIVTAWRKAHPRTRSLWYDMEAAARQAINNLGASFGVRDLITFDVKPDTQGLAWLRMRLPSGRYLCYPSPEVSPSGSITHEGMNQYTRKWERLDTYGGKLTENAVQAIARDVFMSGMLRAEIDGFNVCIRVHDELVCETPDDPTYTSEGLAALMCANPSWSARLPLAAAGFETKRYRKE
jgi:DNA polymerase